jgi:hypothetical protein
MNYRMISLSTIPWALASVLLVAPTFGQDPSETSGQPRPQAANSDVEIPACLAQLSLTSKQQDQIREIVRDYDADMLSVWKQFANRYLETIETEALLLTAIEDNLTEAQRTQVREQRRKTAQHQKSVAGTNVKPNQAIDKPASAIEEEIAIVGVSLTQEQEAAADKLQEKCLGRLRSLNRDIHGLHIRLVSLEADKLVEIENVLTQEQLQQLRENRQNAPIEQNIAADRQSPANSN